MQVDPASKPQGYIGLNQIKEFLSQHKAMISQQFAEQSESAARNAAQIGALNDARLAFLTAGQVFKLIGKPQKACINHLQAASCTKTLAATEFEYEQARLILTDEWPSDHAFGNANPDLAYLRAYELGDVAVFASQVARTENKKDWLYNGCLALANCPPFDLDDMMERRFASLIQALAISIWQLNKVGGDLSLLTGLTLLASFETDHIGAQVDFPDNIKKTSYVRTILAVLSELCSDHAEKSNLRWEVILGETNSLENWEHWLFAVNNRYSGIKDSPNTIDILQASALRQYVLRKLVSFRTAFRSRAGRDWAGSVADLISGSMLWDESDKGTSRIDLLTMAEANIARNFLDELCGKFSRFPTVGEEAESEIMDAKLFNYKSNSELEVEPIAKQEAILSSELRQVEALYIVTGNMDKLTSVRSVIRDAEAAYTANNAGFIGTTQPIALADVQQALRNTEVLVEYVVIEEALQPCKGILVIATTRTDRRVVRVDMDSNKLNSSTLTLYNDKQIVSQFDTSPFHALVNKFRALVREGEDIKALTASKLLYDNLIAPVVAQGLSFEQYPDWIIVPSRLLSNLPFGALCEPGGKFLAEMVNLSYAPNASSWFFLNQRVYPDCKTSLCFGNPNLDPNKWNPLEEAAQELNNIQKELSRFNCTLKMRNEATLESFQELAPSSDVIHLATHGSMSANIDEQYLVFAKNASEQMLRPSQIKRMNLRQCSLIVINACNSGVFRFGPGSEPLGVVPAFLLAGVANVIAARWPLEDYYARIFMERFYKDLVGKEATCALRSTCSSFIKEKMAIRDWSAFALIGSGRCTLARH